MSTPLTRARTGSDVAGAVVVAAGCARAAPGRASIAIRQTASPGRANNAERNIREVSFRNWFPAAPWLRRPSPGAILHIPRFRTSA